MKLVIGGYAQGKLNYVLKNMPCIDPVIYDGELPGEVPDGRTIIVNHLHLWAMARISDGGFPEEEIASFTAGHPDAVIISDEIGSGIVPLDGFEREYRERTGRMLEALALDADLVVRVICGIGQKIK